MRVLCEIQPIDSPQSRDVLQTQSTSLAHPISGLFINTTSYTLVATVFWPTNTLVSNVFSTATTNTTAAPVVTVFSTPAKTIIITTTDPTDPTDTTDTTDKAFPTQYQVAHRWTEFERAGGPSMQIRD